MSYLEGYGVREARREKYLKYGLLTALAAVIVAVTLYFVLRDRQEKQKVEAFLNSVRSGDYKAAYAFWGCSEASPCRDYAFDKFMEDWGPASPQARIAGAAVANTKHCDTGIIDFVKFPDNHEVQLWVDKRTQTIGFAPWPICNPRMKVP